MPAVVQHLLECEENGRIVIHEQDLAHRSSWLARLEAAPTARRAYTAEPLASRVPAPTPRNDPIRGARFSAPARDPADWRRVGGRVYEDSRGPGWTFTGRSKSSERTATSFSAAALPVAGRHRSWCWNRSPTSRRCASCKGWSTSSRSAAIWTRHGPRDRFR